MKRIETMSFWERAYVPEIVRGLSVTGYHFWCNLAIHILLLFGLAKTLQADVTVQYPEEKALYPDILRGRHRLTLNQDDTANCTAPRDAVRMDTGVHPGNLGFTRKDFVEDKKILTDRSRRLEAEGKEALYEQNVSRYRESPTRGMIPQATSINGRRQDATRSGATSRFVDAFLAARNWN